MIYIKNKRSFVFFMALLILAACGGKQQEGTEKAVMVCTTGMIGDVVQYIVGEEADVSTLMGPGVDPHLYKATQGDLQRLNNAAIVFYNGLHLEGKMSEVMEKLGRVKKVVPVASTVPEERLLSPPNYPGAHDPHIWFDVSLWKEASRSIYEALRAWKPEKEAEFTKRYEDYGRQLDSLHTWVKDTLQVIPERQRVLITAHDAFEYFSRAYDIEVRGLQGISTLSEYGLKDVTDLVDFIIERDIKAVFVETSVPQRAISAVVEGCNEKGHDVKIGGSLYSDAMGPAGTPEGTYAGMVRANVRTIVNALK